METFLEFIKRMQAISGYREAIDVEIARIWAKDTDEVIIPDKEGE